MPSKSRRPRAQPVFGLTLLESLRDQDRPEEFLEDEVPSVTMPRRLGLSDVVDRQIRSYRQAVRQRRRMSDDEVRDLIRLVVRRPDAAEIFHRAGRRLAARAARGTAPWATRVLPRALAFHFARRAAARGLNRLFGRRVGGLAHGPFALEGRGLLFMDGDPSGKACQFVSGFCQAVVSERLGPEYQVAHTQCQAHGDSHCRWAVTGEARQRERDGVREMLLRPEMETG